MALAPAFARLVALIGAGAVAVRHRNDDTAKSPAMGNAPAIPKARPQGAIPTLKMPTREGLGAGITSRRRRRG